MHLSQLKENQEENSGEELNDETAILAAIETESKPIQIKNFLLKNLKNYANTKGNRKYSRNENQVKKNLYQRRRSLLCRRVSVL